MQGHQQRGNCARQGIKVSNVTRGIDSPGRSSIDCGARRLEVDENQRRIGSGHSRYRGPSLHTSDFELNARIRPAPVPGQHSAPLLRLSTASSPSTRRIGATPRSRRPRAAGPLRPKILRSLCCRRISSTVADPFHHGKNGEDPGLKAISFACLFGGLKAPAPPKILARRCSPRCRV